MSTKDKICPSSLLKTTCDRCRSQPRRQIRRMVSQTTLRVTSTIECASSSSHDTDARSQGRVANTSKRSYRSRHRAQQLSHHFCSTQKHKLERSVKIRDAGPHSIAGHPPPESILKVRGSSDNDYTQQTPPVTSVKRLSIGYKLGRGEK